MDGGPRFALAVLRRVRIARDPCFDYARSMNGARDLASVAALLGDTTRARMLMELMDGRSWTATELALAGDVSASTASSHLARLTKSGLLSVRRQGRHRYYRIASVEVATTIEGLSSLNHDARGRHMTGPRDPALRRARICYDHLAGEVGVRLLARLREESIVAGDEDSPMLAPKAASWCLSTGIDFDALRASRRPVCRTCLDWSERRPHLAGGLGAAILDRLLEVRCARRVQGSRAIVLSPRGEAFVARLQLATR